MVTTIRERTRVNACKACRKRQAKAIGKDGISAVYCPCGACVILTGSITEAILSWNATRAVSW